jgi:hypothetical protein
MKKAQSLECSRRGCPVQIPMSEGGVKRPLMLILVVVETQTTPVVESWRHWVGDFPLQRENTLI